MPPDIGKPKAGIENFYNTLETIIHDIPVRDKVILLGDFNARVDKEIRAGIKQKHNEEVENGSGEMPIDAHTTNYELTILSTFMKNNIKSHGLITGGNSPQSTIL